MTEGERKPDEDNQKPERLSGISRIVGTDKATEENMKRGQGHIFDEQYFEEWEREKTPEEREIIEGVLSKLPEFVERFGGKPLPLTEDHVHIVDENKITGEEREWLKIHSASYSSAQQLVRISYLDPIADSTGEKSKLYFAEKLVHELLHFSSFQSYKKTEPWNISERRTGFSMRIRKGTEFYFNQVDEALAQEAMTMFDEQYFKDIPALSEELEKREVVREELRKAGKPVSAEMVGFVAENNVAMPYGYSGELINLRRYLSEVAAGNNSEAFLGDETSSVEKVREAFLKALFTGKLLDVAKMVEHYGGKGTFRRLGELTKRDRGMKIKKKNGENQFRKN